MIHRKKLGILGIVWVTMALISCADEERILTGADRSGIVAVDLGLSVMWGDRNLGAESPGDFGINCGWGDPTGNMKGDNALAFGGADAPNEISGTELDIAHMKLGGKWRLPTKAELQELKDYCSWDSGRYDNYKYGFFVYGSNGNSIFIPCDHSNVSDYWSGTLSGTGSESAYCLYYTTSYPYHYTINTRYRNNRLNIRPVCDY